MHPGPIDNSPIIGEFPAELRTGLSEGIDFVLVTDIVAKKLFEKYKVNTANMYIFSCLLYASCHDRLNICREDHS